jgi:uncharacterized protein
MNYAPIDHARRNWATNGGGMPPLRRMCTPGPPPRLRHMAALMSLRQDSGGEPPPVRRRRPPKLTPFVRIVTEAGNELCTHCEVAESPIARMRGLMGRGRLEPGQGMLINGTASIQMLFMRFPIDVVFLDRNRAIVGISHDVMPWKGLAGARGAGAALELPAGTASEHGLELGDVLTFEPA